MEGAKYLHDNSIIHRDLKIANILMNKKGEVKLADFGLARKQLPNQNSNYTVKVVTLWYRAPELLFGQRSYTTQIDMWSIGCIFAELVTGSNLFRGDGEYRQVEKILEICGTPDEKSWPILPSLPYYKDMMPKRRYERKLEEYIRKNAQLEVDENLISLIDGLLRLNPDSRLNCVKALDHPIFKEEPLPCEPQDIQKIPQECHDTLL